MASLDELQTLASAISELEDPDHRDAIRLEFYQAAIAYFDDRLRQTRGELTPDLLKEIDPLYDTTGFPKRISEHLGLSLHELRVALGRQRGITCERCGQSFVVIEPRKKGGYTPSKDTLCKSCDRQRRQEESRLWAEKGEAAREELAAEIAVDVQIKRAKDPLTVEAYVDHLYTYLDCWRDSGWYRILDFGLMYRPHSPGCMICGNPEIQLFVTKEAYIPLDSAHLELANECSWLPERSEQYGLSVPLLETYHQALWRMSPKHYFETFLDYPVVSRPLLCLCQPCSLMVSGTHTLLDIAAKT